MLQLDWLSSRPTGSSCLLPSACQQTWLFTLGIWRSNSGLHAYKASTSLTEPSLWPLFAFFKLLACMSQPTEPFPGLCESQVPASGVSILTPVRMLPVYLSISASQPGVSLLQEAGSFGNVWRHPVTAKSGGANGIWKGEDRETTEGQCSSEVTPYEKAVESHNRPQCCTGKFWCTPYSIQHCWPIVNSVLLTFRLANSVV